MSNSDPKDKQKLDKQEQEKPVEKKPPTSTPPIPERPEPNVTRAQKSLNEGTEDKSGNDDDE